MTAEMLRFGSRKLPGNSQNQIGLTQAEKKLI